jgi:hypothetical protein
MGLSGVSVLLEAEQGGCIQYRGGLRPVRPRFDSRQGKSFFLYSTTSRLALGPTQAPIQWVKRAGREADHSPPSSVEVKHGGAILPQPHTFSWCSA